MRLHEEISRLKELMRLNENIDFNNITFFKTAQGSKYIRLPDGRLRRWKSNHSNTGGEDMGLHGWSSQSIFVSPEFEHAANSIQYLINKFKVALSKDAEGKMFPMISDGSSWRPATWKDAYSVFAKQNPDIADKVLFWKYKKEPEVGYHVVDFDLKGGDKGTEIKGYHFGSPVSEVGEFTDEDKKLFFPSQFSGDKVETELNERCWKGYTQKGMKTMFGKRYPNCVKKSK